MKIRLEKYNPEWGNIYGAIKEDLNHHLAFLHPVIEHIGSTSIIDITAKPIIDILVGLQNEDDLDKTVDPLIGSGYIFYEKYNSVMPYRRFFVKLKFQPDNIPIPQIYHADDKPFEGIDDYKQAHIHVLEFGSDHWKRHVAFRDYLKQNADVRDEYQEIKVRLSALDWQNGNEYNAAKEDFILETQQKALEWHERKNNDFML